MYVPAFASLVRAKVWRNEGIFREGFPREAHLSTGLCQSSPCLAMERLPLLVPVLYQCPHQHDTSVDKAVLAGDTRLLPYKATWSSRLYRSEVTYRAGRSDEMAFFKTNFRVFQLQESAVHISDDREFNLSLISNVTRSEDCKRSLKIPISHAY